MTIQSPQSIVSGVTDVDVSITADEWEHEELMPVDELRKRVTTAGLVAASAAQAPAQPFPKLVSGTSPRTNWDLWRDRAEIFAWAPVLIVLLALPAHAWWAGNLPKINFDETTMWQIAAQVGIALIMAGIAGFGSFRTAVLLPKIG